jgi:hypothetical protein
MSTKKLNRTEARAKNFKTVFGKKAKRLAVRRGVKAPVLTRADFAMQRHTIEGLRDELGREVLRRQDRESRITHLDKEIAGIGERVKKATNEGFEKGQKSMKYRALNIAHKIAGEEGKAPGSSWSGRVEANLDNLLIRNIFDVSIHEYADEKKPCCERDYDHDGNCDVHPEKDQFPSRDQDKDVDPRGCPEQTKPCTKEAVNHPAHYGGDTTYEVIKVLEAWGVLDFCLGNTIKYVARAGKKSEEMIQDLKKALWYLDHRIKQLEKAK